MNLVLYMVSNIHLRQLHCRLHTNASTVLSSNSGNSGNSSTTSTKARTSATSNPNILLCSLNIRPPLLTLLNLLPIILSISKMAILDTLLATTTATLDTTLSIKISIMCLTNKSTSIRVKLSLEVLAGNLKTRLPSPACLFRLQKGHTLRLEQSRD